MSGIYNAYFRTVGKAVQEPEPVFHTQWWFLGIVAHTGVIVILGFTSVLCLFCFRTKEEPKKPSSTTSTSHLNANTEPEDGGFGNFEMTRQSQRPNNFASIGRGATKNGIYARSPPRPSPASVAYSDDEDDRTSTAKPPLPDDDDDDSSMTEKPSEFGDSTEPSDQESDEDSLPPPPPPASPPPPPFTAAIRTPYMSQPSPVIHNTWQNQNNSSFNAYQYTDSEAESSHYALSLNGGQIIMNNTAGSRAPLPGFSSFV